MSDESLKAGDWVRAQSGHEGKIVLISRLSAFVDVQHEDKTHTVTFLLSELTRIDPPHTREKTPGPPSH
jgi:preprotein translocase subunit YajC